MYIALEALLLKFCNLYFSAVLLMLILTERLLVLVVVLTKGNKLFRTKKRR